MSQSYVTCRMRMRISLTCPCYPIRLSDRDLLRAQTEREVFDLLGLPYLEPKQRSGDALYAWLQRRHKEK